MEEMSFYEPFKKIEEIEKYFNKEIKYNDVPAEVIGASCYNHCLKIELEMKDGSGERVELTSMSCFYTCTYDGHPLGRKM